MKAIKRQFSVLWDSLMYEIVLIIGSGLIGAVLFQIIMRTDKSITSYVSLGTLIGCMIAVIYTFIMSAGMPIYFNLEVSMGCTRKEFFLTYFAVCVMENIFALIFLAILCRIENTIYARVYPALSGKINLLPYLFKFGIPAAIGLVIVGGLCGTLVMRFGKKAFWIIWGLWMVGGIAIPQIHEAQTEAPNSVFGIIGNKAMGMFRGIPGNIWIFAAVIFCLVSFAVNFYLIRKQQVA